MSHENQKVREARGSGDRRRKGTLIATGGRTGGFNGRPPLASSPVRYRLKRSLEVLAAADGRIYLMRAGTGEDFVIPEPSETERAIIDSLSRAPVTRAGLRQAIPGAEQGEAEGCLRQLLELGLVERLLDCGSLSPAQAERYDRQLIYWADLAGPGESAASLQGRLAKARVVVLGCGGLGSWAATGLACAGVGGLVLIDGDRVETSNLNRQLLFEERDIGQPKVESAAASLRRHNSELDVTTIPRAVTGPDDLAACLPGADFLIAAADWPPYRLQRWVNRACLDLEVPYVTAAQFLPRVRVGPTVIPGRSPCWECVESQAREGHPHYDEVADRPPGSTAAATLGAASGIVGSLMAMEAIHHLTGAVAPATCGTAVTIDLRTLEVTRERVHRNPRCAQCGRVGGDHRHMGGDGVIPVSPSSP